mgnify:CR=1 FL=1
MRRPRHSRLHLSIDSSYLSGSLVVADGVLSLLVAIVVSPAPPASFGPAASPELRDAVGDAPQTFPKALDLLPGSLLRVDVRLGSAVIVRCDGVAPELFSRHLPIERVASELFSQYLLVRPRERPVPVERVNAMERVFLGALGFDLYVPRDQYEACVSELHGVVRHHSATSPRLPSSSADTSTS